MISYARDRAWWLGLLLVAMLAAAALLLAGTSWAERWGLGSLTLAIIIGMLVGNSAYPPLVTPGVDFCKRTLLRLGIVLYGFRLTFQQIAEIGVAGLVIGALVVILTFTIAVRLGTRVFKLERETSILIGAGSAICGAAAVMATEPVVRGQAHRASIAVATVVVFGTLGMFVYPLLYPYLGIPEHVYGVYAGSTIHEVAQVVIAGEAVGAVAASTAVTEKMFRVMLLAPFLLLLSMRYRGGEPAAAGREHRIVIPWFAVFFIAIAGINSLRLVPPSWVSSILQVDTVLLTMAMAALGLHTQAAALRLAGLRPLLLAASLWLFLLVGGLAINLGVLKLVALAGW